MGLKYLFAGFIAASTILGCTEPKEPQGPTLVSGTIRSISIVKDVFQNTETTSLTLDTDGVDILNPDSVCMQAKVHITSSTSIHTSADPTISLGLDALQVGQTVQVTPTTASDGCPIDITAQEITILINQKVVVVIKPPA